MHAEHVPRASMGPPSMNGGRSTRARAPEIAQARFNGAAVDERRKVDGAEAPRWSTGGFNGAAVDERRKAMTFLERLRRLARFNGAAVDERRKAAGGRAPAVRTVVASMGPPSMNGGRVCSTSCENSAKRSFNGAAVDERRKGTSGDPGDSRYLPGGLRAVREGHWGDDNERAARGGLGPMVLACFQGSEARCERWQGFLSRRTSRTGTQGSPDESAHCRELPVP